MRLTIEDLFSAGLMEGEREAFGSYPCTKAGGIGTRHMRGAGLQRALDIRMRMGGGKLSFVIPGRAPLARTRNPSLLALVRRNGFRVRSLRSRPGMTSFMKRSHRHLAVQDRRAGCEALGRIDDGVGVDAVVAIEVGDGAGLAEMLDAERFDAMTAHAADPAQRRRMAVEHGDDAAIARQGREQLLDMAQMLHAAAVAAQLPRRGPTRVESVDR